MADTATKTTSETAAPREVKIPVLERETLVRLCRVQGSALKAAEDQIRKSLPEVPPDPPKAPTGGLSAEELRKHLKSPGRSYAAGPE